MGGLRFGGVLFDLSVRQLSRSDDQVQGTKRRNTKGKSFDTHGSLHLNDAPANALAAIGGIP
jgi:hypothetical protein